MAEKMSMRDRIKSKAESSGSRDVGYLKLPTGVELFQVDPKKKKATLDFIPYKVTQEPNLDDVPAGSDWYRRGFKVHRAVGPDDAIVVCPKTIGKKCPICEEFARLKKDPDAEAEDAESIRPKLRYLYNVKDREGNKFIWDVSHHLFQKWLDQEIHEGDDSLADFAEVKTGSSLTIRFSEETYKKNVYYSTNRIDFVSREEPVTKADLADACDLDSILIIHSYDTLRAMLMGADVDEDEDASDKAPKKVKKEVDEDDEDEPPKKKKVLDDDEDEPPKKKRPVDEDDEDEVPKKKKVLEDDEDEVPPKKRKTVSEDDEDEVPKKKKVLDDDDDPPKKKKLVDEDDEDAPPIKRKLKKASDDDEDEPPKKKKPLSRDDDDDDPPVKRKKPSSDDDEDSSLSAECPSGYRFGKDVGKKKSCERCKIYDDCREAYDKEN